MRRCVIHIGHAKTATTYLQHALHDNQALLLRHGWWVPADFTSVGSYDLTVLSAERANISGNLAPLHALMVDEREDQLPAMWQALFGPAHVPDGSNLLLSSELFFYYPHAIARVVNHARSFGFAPEIVAYVPRQDQGALSSYLQNVRNHEYTLGVTDFLLHDGRMHYCRYLRAMTRLSATVSGTPIHLRSFAPAFLKDADILTDFLDAIGSGVLAGSCVRPAAVSNRGLLLEQYELLRAAALMRRTDAAARLREEIAGLGVSAGERDRVRAYYYRPHVQAFLQEHYIAENAALLDGYMPQCTDEERDYWLQCAPAKAAPALDAELLQRLRREAFG